MQPDKDVLNIALVFKRELSKRRIKYEWPIAKDITKTYHYRWFRKFLLNCRNKHNLDMQESILVLKSIMNFAEKNGLLNRGAAILQRSDQIEIFVKSANDEIERERQVQDEIIKCKEFLSGKSRSYLVKKEKRGGYTNLTRLFMDGKLPAQFIAMSKMCMRIYNRLDEDEKELLPPIIKLAKLKNKTIRLMGLEKIKKILREDFNGQNKK